MKLLEAQNVHKKYDGGVQVVDVLQGVDLDVDERALIGVYGTSGSGKSTLLHMLGGLDRPTSGKISFMGEDIYEMGEPELARMRNKKVGFVFQFYHLLSEFTAAENVMIPCMIAGERRALADGPRPQ